jgi:iron complex outermembrane receptor protein
MKLNCLSACIALAYASSSMAETTMPTIEVAAEKPTEVQSIAGGSLDEEAIAPNRASTNDTARLLDGLPGVNLYGAGGVSSMPVIHGLADDRLRIQVDGMDLISACGNHMNPPLSYIDPANVESVEVFAGITPVSVGGDSIGSTIQVESTAPKFADPGEGALTEGRVGAFYRSNGNVKGGNVSLTLADEKLSVTYTGSGVKSDNYEAADDFKPAGLAAAGRGWLDGDEVGSSSYEANNHALGFAMRNGNHLAELKVGVQDIPYQLWPNQRMDMTGNDSTQLNLRYQGIFDWGSLEARTYHERTRHEMQFGEDKLYWYATPDGVPCVPAGGMMGCAAGMPMDTEGKNSGLSLKTNIALSARDLLRLGVEAQRYRLDDWWDPSGKGMWPDVFWNINDGERDRLGAFAEWEARWNPQWLTLLGARGEKVDMDTGEVQGYNAGYSTADRIAFNAADRSQTDHNLDLTLLAQFTPDEMRTIEFGYARKTRSPNLYERYAWSTHGMSMRMINWAGDGNGYVGNIELDPEVAHTLSATFGWHDAEQEAWGLKVTPYYTYIQDYIDAERCDSDPDGNACKDANLTATDAFVYLRFDNQSAELYGIDVSGHFPLAKIEGYGSFSASGVLNYVRGRNRDTHDDLYNMMPLNATFTLAQQWGAFTNSLEWQLVDEKDRVNAVRNELETAGYGLLNLRSNHRWKQLQVDLGIENLLDKYYEHPLGGAYTGQGKTMSGTDVAWGTAVPGPGRSFYAGVTLEF